MKACDGGGWVLYDDANARIRELEAAVDVLAKEVTESRKALIGRIVDESNKGRNSSSTIHKEYGDALRDTNANPTANAAIEKARAE